MKNIIIFASGKGSNTQNIIDYFRNTDTKISLIVSDSPTSGIFDMAAREQIPAVLVDKETLIFDEFINYLKGFNPSLIVLAGFLKLIPIKMINAFKIVNIHPSLLPKYGGKGMHGENVHKAVIEAKEKKTGITIHYVNEKYDEGEIIRQVTLKLTKDITLEILQEKIHHLEHLYYPMVIDNIINYNL